MRIIRYARAEGNAQLAAWTDQGDIYDLHQSDFLQLVEEARALNQTPLQLIEEQTSAAKPLAAAIGDLQLLAPIAAPEVWAAGVTYERSKEARNYEATGGKLDAATFYDKVYDAERPELFFKSTAARTVGPNTVMYLRSDSGWQVPEPELGLVLDSRGRILGYTAGNDLSCRDIEGENPLYLPQAKVWRHSCSIGPSIRLAESVDDPYGFRITCRIFRDGAQVFEGSAMASQLKRRLEELVSYLVRDNHMFDGTVLLTGTCIVPPNEFTLQMNDRIEIDISGIGTLANPVTRL